MVVGEGDSPPASKAAPPPVAMKEEAMAPPASVVGAMPPPAPVVGGVEAPPAPGRPHSPMTESSAAAAPAAAPVEAPPATPEAGGGEDVVVDGAGAGAGVGGTEAADAAAPPREAVGSQKLLLGVRMFLYGSQQHLSAYDLSRLGEIADDGSCGPTGTLTQICDCYRPSAYYVGGLDAVAIGLIAPGDPTKPVAYALRTFTVVGQDTVRLSNVAVDASLAKIVDLQGLLLVFAAQLPVLATTLLPSARYIACEARAGGTNYKNLVDVGLPLGPGAALKFAPWTPSVLYKQTFPPSCPDMIYLRADLPGAQPRTDLLVN